MTTITAAAADRLLRQFEGKSHAPVRIRRLAGLARRVAGRRLDTGLVREIQALRLREALDYVSAHSPFYQRMFASLGLRPGDIRTVEELQALPFTRGQDIRDWSQFLCVPTDRLAGVFTTSGTTGEPKRVYYTAADLHVLGNYGALAMRMAHPGPLVALIALNMAHGLWIAWNRTLHAVDDAGGLPLPVGADDPGETLGWMRRLRPNMVIASPSYLTELMREAQRQGYRPRLDQVVSAAEAMNAEQRALFAEYWQAQVFDGYGSTEMGAPLLLSWPPCTAFNTNDLQLVTEIVDPVTGRPADEGELVFTTLRREAMPLVRYRSGDAFRWAACDSWLPFATVEYVRRLDDLLTVGAVHTYGHIIADALAKVPGASGRLEIVVDKVEMTDRLTLRVEGHGVQAAEVERALYAVYPLLPASVAEHSLLLRIETDVDLGRQLKPLKIEDRRSPTILHR